MPNSHLGPWMLPGIFSPGVYAWLAVQPQDKASLHLAALPTLSIPLFLVFLKQHLKISSLSVPLNLNFMEQTPCQPHHPVPPRPSKQDCYYMCKLLNFSELVIFLVTVKTVTGLPCGITGRL